MSKGKIIDHAFIVLLFINALVFLLMGKSWILLLTYIILLLFMTFTNPKYFLFFILVFPEDLLRHFFEATRVSEGGEFSPGLSMNRITFICFTFTGVLYFYRHRISLLNLLKRTIKLPGGKPYLVYILIAVIGILNAGLGIDKTAIVSVVNLLYPFIAFLLIVHLISSREVLLKVITITGLSIIIPFIWQVIQLLIGKGGQGVGEAVAYAPALEGFHRLSGPFSHEGRLAYWVMMLVPLFAAMAHELRRQHNKVKKYYTGLLGISLLSVIGTYMRGAWVGTVLILAWFYQRFSKVRLGVFLILLIFVANAPIFNARFMSSTKEDAMSKIGGSSGRLKLWSEYVIPQIMQHPFFGLGYGNLDLVFYERVYKQSGVKWAANYWALSAHNEYLNQAIYLGIIGTFVYIWYFLDVLAFAGRVGRSSTQLTKALSVGLQGLTLAILLTALVDIPWAASAGKVLYFALIAFTYLAYKQDEDRSKPKINEGAHGTGRGV